VVFVIRKPKAAEYARARTSQVSRRERWKNGMISKRIIAN
jgi:hypothetical protein